MVLNRGNQAQNNAHSRHPTETGRTQVRLLCETRGQDAVALGQGVSDSNMRGLGASHAVSSSGCWFHGTQDL